MRIYVLDGGGPKDSENTLNSFLTKCGEKVFWQIGADMPYNALFLPSRFVPWVIFYPLFVNFVTILWHEEMAQCNFS